MSTSIPNFFTVNHFSPWGNLISNDKPHILLNLISSGVLHLRIKHTPYPHWSPVESFFQSLQGINWYHIFCSNSTVLLDNYCSFKIFMCVLIFIYVSTYMQVFVTRGGHRPCSSTEIQLTFLRLDFCMGQDFTVVKLAWNLWIYCSPNT